MPPPPPSDAAPAVAFPAAAGPALPRLTGLKRVLALLGPAWLVAVGYIDPGNWATDLAAGSAHGYALLWVVAAAGLAAVVLQVLAARLGLATGRDLASLSAATCGPSARLGLWLLAEVAICACDLAELIGAAIALKLLFAIPLALGVALTAFDVLLLLAIRGKDRVEGLIRLLLAAVALAFVAEVLLARPEWSAVLQGLAPSRESLARPGAVYLAAGIVGATVMPHNLYLHSALARQSSGSTDLRRRARFLTRDTCVALLAATLVNAAILILAGAAFHGPGVQVAGVQDAYRLLKPLLGPAAAVLFAMALLGAGQSSSLTATMAGQVVMEGFVNLKLSPARRRAITRGLALIPALGAALFFGEGAVSRLLVGSQVLLSLQLPFAMIPLLRLAGDPRRMGALLPPAWLIGAGWAVAVLILGLNAAMLAAAVIG